MKTSCLRMLLRSTITVVALLTALPVVSSAGVVVVPNANTNVEGTGGTKNFKSTPFNCNFVGFMNERVQQVYLGSEVGSGQISKIAFRPNGVNEQGSPDSDLGTAFGPTTINNVTIKLSTTAVNPDGLSDTDDAGMDMNVGADVTTVFNGNLTLQSAATGGPPRNFDIMIPLTTPFTFNSSNGNLLMEVIIPTCTQADTTFFDVQETMGDSISRAIKRSSTGNTIFFTTTDGLVTQFTIEQADLAVTKGATISGTTVTSSILLTNNGPDTSVNVVLTDTVPAHTTFESITPPAGFTCVTPPVGGTGLITCTGASLAAGTTVKFVLNVRLAPGTPPGTGISNTVAVTSDTFDPDASNNSATATVIFRVSAPAMSLVALVVCALLLMAAGVWLRSKRPTLG